MRLPYQYVVLRCVPRVEREEFVNVGVVPFPQVLSLHRSNPELFQTGGVSVVVPGVGVVPATWCDGI